MDESCYGELVDVGGCSTELRPDSYPSSLPRTGGESTTGFVLVGVLLVVFGLVLTLGAAWRRLR
jgi:LPXTG-motif cell wall-anchored protein